MKRIFSVIIVSTLLCFGLTGCASSESDKKLEEYKTSMETFFTNLEEIDGKINEIDPNSQDAMDQLFTQFDVLQNEFSTMAALEVPTEGAPDTFAYIESLADDAASYMVQANEYMHQAFDESSYNENTLNGALECYSRANKRVLYIVDLLHGEYPQGDNISYSN